MDRSLCHVKFNNLVRISKMTSVRGLPRLRNPDKVMCKKCRMGQMKKSSFKSKTCGFDVILDFGVKIYYGDKYFILLVDDFSRKCILIVKF